MFELLESDKTGLNFSNTLTATPTFNMFKYMYFYNGAGVAAGDFNNDGQIDLFFSSNQGQNKLFLNTGKLQFEDVTTAAHIPTDSAWSTGVSVIDINNDGLLDIYVCRVGNFESLQSHNQFLICKGLDKNNVPYYEDEAAKMGLATSAFSTQAAFLDYDADGDMDMYLMNHSLRYNGTYNERNSYNNTIDTLAADILFKNDDLRFTNISTKAGITGTVISYGLGLCVADVNMDGWPDIYVGNDFHENDYLYINQKNGTFKETLQQQTMHTSQFSMGVDVADITNDGNPEIISMDMLPNDPKILKHSLEEDDYNLFNYKIKYGYHPQFSRNALQINRGNGMFSDAAMYAGVEATDWSWAALFTDFDNDGNKDLFVSNGIPKRLNDMDYVNFVTNGDIQEKIRNNTVGQKDMLLIEKFPQIKLANKFFVNKTNAHFEDIESQIVNDKPTYSNGAVYADFDNDGDVDIVVNNIDENAMLYQNKTNNKHNNIWVDVKVVGTKYNINAIGTKLIAFYKNKLETIEKYPARGFMSSMETPIHLGLGATPPDSLVLIWPDNTYEKINFKTDTCNAYTYKIGLPVFDYNKLQNFNKNTTNTFENISTQSGIFFNHIENPFNEFDREQLIPHMVSREGPALAVADVNADGLADIFIGSAKAIKPVLYIQQQNGKFILSKQIALDNDSTYEDVDANFADINGDGFIDLLVASGGNEYYGNSEYLQPRIYINDGKGNFSKLLNAFDKTLQLTASCIKPYDFNSDGFIDLFIGGRAVPWEYGKIPTSYLLQNDGTGKFKNVTEKYNKELENIGMVTNANWSDIDNDEKKDLIVTLEWGGIVAFKNNTINFTKKIITAKQGWWNFVLPIDVDADGDIDFIAGNLGENNRFKASENTPLNMYYNDFDDNGKKEQFLTYFLSGREIPFGDKDELTKQLPSLKKKFLFAEDFANSSLKNIFGADKLSKADKFTATYFTNVVLINNGNFNFSITPLPWQAQLSCYRDAVIINANNDSLPDVMLGGNFYHSNIRLGKYDADFGSILVNAGNGNFVFQNINNQVIKGEIRHLLPITVNKKPAIILVRNNDSAMLLKPIIPITK